MAAEDLQKPKFPPEIITEILSTLPPKPLARFKSVSKPLLHLISDPKFVKRNLTLNRSKTLKIFFASNLGVYSSDPKSLKNGLILASKIKNYPLKTTDPDGDSIELFGSSNGLICIAPPSEGTYTFFIYNPTTGESKQIPDDKTPRIPFSSPDIYGFGYSQTLDDYKFLKIARGEKTLIYSLKSDSWKTSSEKFPYNPPYYRQGTILNGSIHWVQSRGTLENHSWRVSAPASVQVTMIDVSQSDEQSMLPYLCVIAAFDLAQEKYIDIQMPIPDMDFRRYDLGVLDGNLCLMHNTGVHNDMWIMKEYGVKESWTRIVMNLEYSILTSLCLAEDGDNKGALMVINQNRLVLMNLENGTCIDLRVKKMRGKTFESVVYDETLVSPSHL